MHSWEIRPAIHIEWKNHIVAFDDPVTPDDRVLNFQCFLQKDELKPVKEATPASPPQAMDISQSEAFSKQLLPVNVQDIDQDDGDNPQLVAEYVNDIYDYMRQLEVRPRVLT